MTTMPDAYSVEKTPGLSWRERAAELNRKGLELAQRYNVLAAAAKHTRNELELVKAELAWARRHPIRWLIGRRRRGGAR